MRILTSVRENSFENEKKTLKWKMADTHPSTYKKLKGFFLLASYSLKTILFNENIPYIVIRYWWSKDLRSKVMKGALICQQWWRPKWFILIRTWTVLSWIGGGGVQIIAWSSGGVMVLLQVLKLNSLPAPVTSSVLSLIAMMLIKSEIETLWLHPK